MTARTVCPHCDQPPAPLVTLDMHLRFQCPVLTAERAGERQAS